MNKALSKVKEFLSYSSSGVASPGSAVFYETSDIPLAKSWISTRKIQPANQALICWLLQL